MDKNEIKKYLKSFVSEAKSPTPATAPAIKLAKKIGKENEKENKAGLKAIAKDMNAYEKGLTKDDPNKKDMVQNKINYNTDDEKNYHDQMEIMNGQEMIQYDREPNKVFKDRAIEAIEGSTRMGNNPEWANVVAKGQGGDPEFGKNLVKRIKASEKKRSEQTPVTKMFGDDWEVVKDKSHKPYAFENTKSKKVIKEVLSEKGIANITNMINKFGSRETAVKLVDLFLNRMTGLGASELPDTATYADGLDNIEESLNQRDFESAFRTASETAKEMLEGEGFGGFGLEENKEKCEVCSKDKSECKCSDEEKGKQAMKGLDQDYEKDSRGQEHGIKIKENIDKKYKDYSIDKIEGSGMYRAKSKNVGYLKADTLAGLKKLIDAEVEKSNKKTKIKESMKRLRFKKEFNGVGNALKLIPESYKVDSKVFEMTDGNENYRIRWEGSVNEGNAVILMASDKTLVNEDMQKMKRLMGYKSEDTIGTLKGKERIDENKAFSTIWDMTKKLMTEVDENEGDAEEGDWDDAVTSQASEAKEHIEGSTSSDKGTHGKAKTGHWEDAAKSQAPEAKKHVQGSASGDKGTQAKAKTGDLDKAVTKQAPEAKAHMSESKKKLNK